MCTTVSAAALAERMFHLKFKIRDITLDPRTDSWPNFRASQPPIPESQNWEEEITFDKLVDRLVLLQRWIKELDAWIRMGQALINQPYSPFLSIAETDVTEADDSLIGVWINRAKEPEAAWYWRHHIPIFVVHEIRGGKDEPNAETAHRTSSPLHLMDWETNTLITNWRSLAKASQINILEHQTDPLINYEASETKNAEQSWRSSSLSILNNFPGLDTRFTAQENPIPGLEKYGPKIPETETLSSDRVPWIIPPEVMEAPAKSQWEWFVEDMDDKENRCLRQDIIVAQGVQHDINVFGLPGPMIRYYEDTARTKCVKVSDWLYKTLAPEKNHRKRVAPKPMLSCVPKLHTDNIETIHSSNQEPMSPSPPSKPLEEEVTRAPIYYPPRFSQLDEDDELDFGDSPSPIARQKELPPVEEPAIIETEIHTPESEPLVEVGTKRKRRLSSLSDQSPRVSMIANEIIQSWASVLGKKTVPPVAPSPLLRLLNFQGSLSQLREILSITCEMMAAEICITRIIKEEMDRGMEYWIKLWDNREAGWFIRAHYNLPLNQG
ncbi:hypothetical protein K435DRAFT_872849 [Dendrothele bispora CBS 962.96]|uniref:Uncharacterized protein n=1 Tax=Dendrothele bispora (strain CBS 962.96) TaxID=1314807 RepID=A0A4S8L0M3_DENBC|nr:hypothetical protein K435DRAFT_872849 [Dendrothele bispora CBS 962.96]